MDRYKIITDFVREHKWRYILGIIFILAVDILQLVFPKILGYLVDDLQTMNITMRIIAKYIGIIILVAFATFIFRFLFRIYIFGTEKKLERHLRKTLFDHLLTLSPSFYNTHKTGELMAYATNDINAVRASMGMGVLLITDTFFLTITTLFIMLRTIDVRLTLLALIPLPIISILSVKFGTIVHSRFKAVQEAFAGLSDKAQESISGIRVIKSFVQEDKELESFNQISKNAFNKNIALAKLWAIANPFVGLIVTLSFIIVLGYGGTQVVYGKLSLGDFVAFNTYLGMLIWPMMAFGWMINLLQRGRASLDRLNIILHTKPDIEDVDPLDIDEIVGEITFKDVTFTYPRTQEPVLKNINIHIPAGNSLGVIGGTGSGKSTFANLILRLFEAQRGQILVDGYPIEHIPLAILRENIGYVPQDSFLFSTTIAENIAFSNIDLSMDKIERAAKMAHVYDDIKAFPEGFDTIVGERGVTLSGGQKQRVSIARALITDPNILILDDSLSAVDTQTEDSILSSLKDVVKKRTSIIISHRVSTIQNTDEIIFLDGGEIVERGTHEELLALKGHYYSLYQKQLLEDEVTSY